MDFSNDFEFRKRLEQSDNPYTEVVSVMKAARKLAAECDNKILHSAAISHVINGTEPAHVFVEDFRDEYIAYHVRELFCGILDTEIKNAVYDSFYDSKEKRNLVYRYNGIMDENKRARVRVLTRMLWFKLIK